MSFEKWRKRFSYPLKIYNDFEKINIRQWWNFKNITFNPGITFIEYQFPLVMHMTMHYRISQRQIIKGWYDSYILEEYILFQD